MWSNISSYPKSLCSPCTSECLSPSNNNNNDQSRNNPESNRKQSQDEQQQEFGSPLMRYKHAICSTPSGYIYIHGGRFGNLPLDDDIWRFDPHHNTWLQLKTTGLKPPNLQEHTLVEYNDCLYLFGGQVSASNTENSFWSLNLATNQWQSLSLKNNKFSGAYLGPKNKRGHSAVIYKDSMYVFGGFEDFRGSSAQLWEYDLIMRRWELRNLSSTSACHPEARHSHSAIVFKDSMYIYGGLSDLKPLSDLWCWSWKDKRWFKERTKGTSPGQLHGHSAIQAFGSMFVFGGERNGRTTRSLWRLNLSNLTWQKIRPKGPKPMPTTWHCAIANPLSILDEANYIIEGCADNPRLFLKSINSELSEKHDQSITNHDDDDNKTIEQCQTNGINNNANKTTTITNLKHSISTNVVIQKSQEQASSGNKSRHIIQNGNANQQYRKRKSSRLSFLKRKTRPKSTYELKQLCNSVSANDFKLTTTTTNLISNDTNCAVNLNINEKSQRHSIAIEKPSKIKVEKEDIKMEDDKLTITGDREVLIENNNKIFDNLQTDIKQMFQQHTENSVEQMFVDDLDLDNDNSNTLPSDMSQQQTTYQTAQQTMQSQNDIITKQLDLRSQRTSYAYTTPPSEANTLREFTNGIESQQSININNNMNDETLAKIVSGNNNYTNSYRRTGNKQQQQRPKSEIVQSLIDRADDRIKHLYTPFFNRTTKNNNNTMKSNNNESAFNSSITSSSSTKAAALGTEIDNKSNRINHDLQKRSYRHSLDRSKRHTIHQTTTFYNLYFSEDKSSSSPTTSDSNNNSNDNQSQQQQQQTGEQNIDQDFNTDDINQQYSFRTTTTMKRDDLSSSTIKGSLYTNGNLIGIRGIGYTAAGQHSNQIDQVSQLSLETTNSDSRTLCGDIGQTSPPMESTSTTSYVSSMQNALTTGGRLETAKESGGDNTSLSFSVIAEFEEDDMLQYSSPTEPILNHRHVNNTDMQSESASYHYNDDDNNLQRLERNYKTTLRQQQSPESHNNAMDTTKEENNNTIVAHKSASSGYDSINGDQELRSLNGAQYNQRLSPNKFTVTAATPASTVVGQQNKFEQNEQSNSQSERSQGEDSSVRTESSLGFNEHHEQSSPEQAGLKKLDQFIKSKTKAGAKRMLYMKNKRSNAYGNTTTASSTTTDSLVLTSEGGDNFELNNSYDNHNVDVMTTLVCQDNQAPTKCLPSSPPSASFETTASSISRAHQLQPIGSTLGHHQRRVPFMSRLTGKQKSKNRYWQLCMFVVGGKQGGIHGANDPITIWRLYI